MSKLIPQKLCTQESLEVCVGTYASHGVAPVFQNISILLAKVETYLMSACPCQGRLRCEWLDRKHWRVRTWLPGPLCH